MTETEPLEVKKIGISEEDNAGATEESQIEASVGEHDVAALVDEAQNIRSDSKHPEGVAEEFDESPSEEIVENKDGGNAVADTVAEATDENIPEPMELDEESKPGKEETERISQQVEETTTKDSNKPEEETKSHIPESGSNSSTEIEETDDVHKDNNIDNHNIVEEANVETVKETTFPSNLQEETILSTPQEQVSIDEPIEDETIETSCNVSNETSQRSTISPIPSKSMKPESNSTPSVLQQEEEPEAPQIQIPEDSDEAQQAHTNDSFSELSETLLNHTSNPSTNVLKSVVDTTIHTLITPSSSEPSVVRPITITSSSSQAVTSAPPLNPNRLQGPGPQANGSQGLPMLVKPPKTDILLQTAKEVLQLRDEPTHVILGMNKTFSV